MAQTQEQEEAAVTDKPVDKAAEQEEEAVDKSDQPQDEDTEMTEADAKEVDEAEQNKENLPVDASAPSSAAAAMETTAEQQPAQSVTKKIVVSAENLQKLVLLRTLHADAIQFIQQIHTAVPIITQLLSSKSKAEVLESMDFLVVGYNYKVAPADVKYLLLLSSFLS